MTSSETMTRRGGLARVLCAALGLALLAACATPPAPRALTEGVLCEDGPRRVEARFSGARAEACAFGPEGVAVTVAPEATPINPSPWYAFRLTSPRAERILLGYADAEHRYAPKLQGADGAWRAVGDSDVALGEEGRLAAFAAPPSPGGLVIAAQPLYTPADHDRDLARWAASGAERRVIGQSAAGRPIEMVIWPAPDPAAPRIVLLGRQHPPEIPGAWALRGLLDALAAAEDPAIADLRARATIVAVPLLNPDGVEAGHWRLNMGGVDLNRDWGPFTQPETRAVRDALSADTGAGPVIAMLDVHATRSTVLYTTPDGKTALVPTLASDLWAALGGDDTAAPWTRRDTWTSGNGTAKTWFAEALGANTMTVELADTVAEAEAEAQGRRIAAALAVATEGAFAAPDLSSKGATG